MLKLMRWLEAPTQGKTFKIYKLSLLKDFIFFILKIDKNSILKE